MVASKRPVPPNGAAAAQPGQGAVAAASSAATTAPASAATAAATAAAARAAARAGLPRVVVITGPTAVGKTAVGLEVALRMGGEVVSADSVQVYRGLDVGSDKIPPGAARRGVPHHLLDVLPFLSDDFSAADFHARARASLADIVARGRTPVVVGGTGLYLRWLVWGRPSTPAGDADTEARALALVRASQRRAAAEAGLSSADDLDEAVSWAAAARAVAEAGDPAAAARVSLERNNWYRLLRVLQILLATGGKPLSEQDLDAQRPWDYDFRCFYLHRPRVPLYERIAARVEEMVCGVGRGEGAEGEEEEGGGGGAASVGGDSGGLLQEAAMLLDAGLPPGSNMAAKAIGYRQAMEWLCAGAERALARRRRSGGGGAGGGGGRDEDEDEAEEDGPAAPAAAKADGAERNPRAEEGDVFSLGDLRQLVLDVAQASRHLVKGQSTWFRGDPAFTWVDAARGAEAAAEEIVALASGAEPPPAVVGGGGGGGEEAEGEEEAGGGAARRSEAAARRQLSREEQDAVRRYRPALPRLDSAAAAADAGARAALARANAAVGAGGAGNQDPGRAERWAALARAARGRPAWTKQGAVQPAADGGGGEAGGGGKAACLEGGGTEELITRV